MAFVLRGGSVKNKIIAIILLVAFIIPMFTFVNADSLTPKTLDEFNLTEEQLSLAQNNGYISYAYYSNGWNGTFTSYDLVILASPDDSFYFKSSGNKALTTTSGSAYSKCIATTSDYNVDFRFSENYSGTFKSAFTDESKCMVISGTANIYNDINCKELFFTGEVKDDTISDPNSDLQLSYEYNEDFTECHINATLKNGSFTDKIYYSNIMPSISGQGLLTKNGFPAERFNS